MKLPRFVYFLALFSLATGFAIYSADTSVMRKGHQLHKMGRGMHVMPMFEFFKFADEIGISNTQLIQLRMVFQKFSKKAELLGMGKGHKMPELKKPESPEEVKSFVSEISKKMEQGMLMHLEMKKELEKILSEDQLKKMDEMRKSHMKFFMGKHGMGRHGMGRHMMPPPPPPFYQQDPVDSSNEDIMESDL